MLIGMVFIFYSEFFSPFFLHLCLCMQKMNNTIVFQFFCFIISFSIHHYVPEINLQFQSYLCSEKSYLFIDISLAHLLQESKKIYAIIYIYNWFSLWDKRKMLRRSSFPPSVNPTLYTVYRKVFYPGGLQPHCTSFSLTE